MTESTTEIMTKLDKANDLANERRADSSSNSPDRSSSTLQATPQLTTKGLTAMLCLMCLVPIITILVLWQIMPPVYEGQLEAGVAYENLPPAEFYAPHYSERPDWTEGQLVVRNESDQDWTHLNIQVNRHYQIYDIEPIPAHGERKYNLDRFVSRTGARFQLRYNPLKSVRIYARRPTRDRATFSHEFTENLPLSN